MVFPDVQGAGPPGRGSGHRADSRAASWRGVIGCPFAASSRGSAATLASGEQSSARESLVGWVVEHLQRGGTAASSGQPCGFSSTAACFHDASNGPASHRASFRRRPCPEPAAMQSGALPRRAPLTAQPIVQLARCRAAAEAALLRRRCECPHAPANNEAAPNASPRTCQPATARYLICSCTIPSPRRAASAFLPARAVAGPPLQQ
jgi:hypothetical protein